MHRIADDFNQHKIISINSVDYINGGVKATLTTSHFDRITTKPYTFELDEWAKIVERMFI